MMDSRPMRLQTGIHEVADSPRAHRRARATTLRTVLQVSHSARMRRGRRVVSCAEISTNVDEERLKKRT